MAISEIAGSAASATLGATQATGVQSTTEQALGATKKTNEETTGTQTAGTTTSGSSSSGDPSRGTNLDITV